MNPAPDLVMLKRLSQLSGLILAMVALRRAADALGLHAPWYLLHELVVLLVPMVVLMREVLPTLAPAQRISFVLTSGAFISQSAIAELLAIQHRYWGFYTGLDPLSGFDLGAIPVEEFLSYPMLLNLPILWYLWLGRVFPGTSTVAAPKLETVRTWLTRAAWASLALAFCFVVLALVGPTDAAPLDAVPGPDAMGAIRFAAGPRQYGWTIVQCLGWAGTFAVAAKVAHRLQWKRLLVMVVTYFAFALFFELLACGRGWWVWNTQQAIGVTAWVLPVESFSMYLTGALFPTLCFEWLAPACEPGEALVEA
ncbi:MAG: lycopene cyclase domain-containing protein [Myxococcaceae bacterium]